MRFSILLISIVLLAFVNVNADLIQLDTISYPVSTSSCPLGELSDFVKNKSLNIVNLLEQMAGDNITLNDLNYLTNLISTDLINMTHIYDNASYSLQISAATRLLSLQTIALSVVVLASPRDSSIFNVATTSLLLYGLPTSFAEEAESGGSHSSSSSSEGHSVGHGEEGFTDPEHFVDADGHVVSSSSLRYGYLIRGVYINNVYHDILEGCLVKNVTTDITEKVTLALRNMTDLEFVNKTMFDMSTMFVNFSYALKPPLIYIPIAILVFTFFHILFFPEGS